MPLEDLSDERTRPWLGEALAVGIEVHLRAAGVDVVEPFEREGRLREKGLAAAAPVSRATVILLGEELGAARAVVGTYRVASEGRVDVRLRLLDLERGATIGVVEDHDALDALGRLEARLAKNLFRLEGDAGPAAIDDLAPRWAAVALGAREELARALAAQDAGERIDRLRRAVELEPSLGEARYLLGRALYEEGDPRGAIEVLGSLSTEDPRYPDAYFLLGLAYLELGEADLAAEVFGALAAGGGDAAALNNWGVALLRAGRLAEALDAFGRAQALEPRRADYAFNRGWCAWQLGRGGEAYRWLEEAVRLAPDDATARLALAAAAASQADADRAREERAAALALAPELAEVDAATATGWERLVPVEAREAPAAGTESASRERAEGAAAPDRFESIRALRAEGLVEKAIAELQRALYLDPHDVDARIELADVYREAGELEKAVSELRVALWDREDAETHLRLAEIYAERGETERALEHAERALELAPASEDARRLVERLRGEARAPGPGGC